jgi:hypothetical protein
MKDFDEIVDETVDQIDREFTKNTGSPGTRTKLLEVKAELMKAWALKICSDKFYRIG